MNNQIHLSRLLVDALRRQDALEDIICEYGIECVRQCGHCRRLMNEGWMYQGFETYCSDECLLAEHPEDNLSDLQAQASDDNSHWEYMYQDCM